VGYGFDFSLVAKFEEEMAKRIIRFRRGRDRLRWNALASREYSVKV